MQFIHIEWRGPFLVCPIDSENPKAESLNKLVERNDRGLYQIYGDHPVYGTDSLHYIGQTEGQTFLQRIQQHHWEREARTITCYVGRLYGDATPSENEWRKQIVVAEKLLIQAHKPAYNARELSQRLDISFADFHVLNWGDRRALLPEVSGAFWSVKFDDWPAYAQYGED